jgi:hypothetical protein
MPLDEPEVVDLSCLPFSHNAASTQLMADLTLPLSTSVLVLALVPAQVVVLLALTLLVPVLMLPVPLLWPALLLPVLLLG